MTSQKPGSGRKAEVEAGDRLDEMRRRCSSTRAVRLNVAGEEHHVGQEPLESLARRQGLDDVPGAMTEEVDAGQGRRPVLARRARARPRRACRRQRTSPATALTMDSSSLSTSPPVDSRASVVFPLPERPAEEIGPLVADQAGRVDDQPVPLDEGQRIEDAHEAVDRELVEVGEGDRPPTLVQVEAAREVAARDPKPQPVPRRTRRRRRRAKSDNRPGAPSTSIRQSGAPVERKPL